MSPYRFELAEPGDDEGLRDIMARTPMPGAISVVFRREPSYFGAAVVEGRFRQVMVIRDEQTSADCRHGITLGRQTVRERPKSGHRLSQRPAHPGGTPRARESAGPRFCLSCGNLHADGRTPLYLTTIAEDNRPALDALMGGRAGLPIVSFRRPVPHGGHPDCAVASTLVAWCARTRDPRRTRGRSARRAGIPASRRAHAAVLSLL